MDQRNLLLAIIVSAAIMFGFQWFYGDQAAPTGPGQAAKQGQQTPSTPAPGPGPGAPASGAQIAQPSPTAPSAPPSATTVPVPGQNAETARRAARKDALAAVRRVVIDAPRLKGSLSLTGARLDDLTLVDYRETIAPDSPQIQLLHPVGLARPYFADFGWVSSDTKVPDATSVWTASADRLALRNPVTLSWDNGQGVRFQQTFGLDENYMFTVTQRVVNDSEKTATVFPFGRISRTGTPDITNFYILHEGLLGVFGGVLKEVDYDDLQDTKIVENKTTGGWIGITDKYWLTALIPDQKRASTTRFFDKPERSVDKYQVDYRADGVTIAPGGSTEMRNRLFAGAKEANLLFDYRDDLGIVRFDLAIDWGWFEFLTKPVFQALLYFREHLGNMGLAILLLTVLIKLAFFPLANKSYRAMSNMKRLQPEMVKLRERFKEDKARMNQEVMALYKREKANPASGCLPVVIQIPVFFALYKVLFVTIEMRQEPFFGWIKDLSAPDPVTITNLFGLIPWTPPDYALIGIWPIVMGITMFLQQKLNPAPADPTQAKIFMFLPFIFTIMLARFPAGLVIYWAWNNSLSILQQYVIMKRSGAFGPKSSGGAKGGSKGAKGSGGGKGAKGKGGAKGSRGGKAPKTAKSGAGKG